LLRDAFERTMQDPAFRADAAKAALDIHPVTAAAVTRTIQNATATPPGLLAAAKRAKGDAADQVR
ncbi:MAG: hypothetical protein QOG83_3250, partial [Alphaproteobacteria bacterium]|nr:hypothetical protein [Alphaproteobacteria bacterium]